MIIDYYIDLYWLTSEIHVFFLIYILTLIFLRLTALGLRKCYTSTPRPLNKYAQNHERRRAHSCTGQIPDNIMSITINRRRQLMFQEFQDCFSAAEESLFFSFCFLITLLNLLPALLFIMTYSSVKIVWQQVWACKAAQQVVLIPPERGVWLLQFAVNKVVL